MGNTSHMGPYKLSLNVFSAHHQTLHFYKPGLLENHKSQTHESNLRYYLRMFPCCGVITRPQVVIFSLLQPYSASYNLISCYDKWTTVTLICGGEAKCCSRVKLCMCTCTHGHTYTHLHHVLHKKMISF